MTHETHRQAADPHAGHETSTIHGNHDRHAGHSVAMFLRDLVSVDSISTLFTAPNEIPIRK